MRLEKAAVSVRCPDAKPRWRAFIAGIVCLICAGALLAPTKSSAIPRGEDGRTTREARTLIGELRLEEAERRLSDVLRRHPDDTDVLTADALIRFYRGDYRGALEAMSRARRPGGEARTLQTIIEATHSATEHFVEARSSDGRYVVRHAPGPDAILVPYALDALRAADTALSDDLGYRAPGPIRLEIYPTPATLAAVSTLSIEEIERTGTIALCKWDRLMVTTPRALVRGYPWMDTVSHELVHLILTRASRDRAPVWFQEGIAKFLERRWRDENAGARLAPAARALLVEASRSDSLLPFERLHPSIARLPSQEQAALAFAQVATFFEYYHDTFGGDALRSAIARVASGVDARDALSEVAELAWPRIEQAWRESIRGLHADQDPPRLLPLRFRSNGGPDGASDELPVARAQRFFRLGDLLYSRGRARAAAREYERAHDLLPDDPRIASRLGRASVESGEVGPAIQALERVRSRYPEHASLHAVLGDAHLVQGNIARARRSLIEAIRLNPFDPAPHCALAVAGQDEAIRNRERETCRELGGTER